MPRIQREQEKEDGWTDWIHPLSGYRLACCDCGLVHDIETRIDDLGQVNFRARRNNRSTGQMRRHTEDNLAEGFSHLSAVLVQDLLETSDADIIAEHLDDTALDALRQLANLDNWAEQVIDGTRTILWAGDPDISPIAIAETGLGVSNKMDRIKGA